MVFITGLNENTLPIYRAESPEEERRLCYVGMTRAMEQLCLSYTDVDANGRDTEPSRFIDESMTPAPSSSQPQPPQEKAHQP